MVSHQGFRWSLKTPLLSQSFANFKLSLRSSRLKTGQTETSFGSPCKRKRGSWNGNHSGEEDWEDVVPLLASWATLLLSVPMMTLRLHFSRWLPFPHPAVLDAADVLLLFRSGPFFSSPGPLSPFSLSLLFPTPHRWEPACRMPPLPLFAARFHVELLLCPTLKAMVCAAASSRSSLVVPSASCVSQPFSPACLSSVKLLDLGQIGVFFHHLSHPHPSIPLRLDR